MKDQVRIFTDEQIKEVFKRTKKTQDLEIQSITYNHYDLFQDSYSVKTNKGNYIYQRAMKQQWNKSIASSEYDRIVKVR